MCWLEYENFILISNFLQFLSWNFCHLKDELHFSTSDKKIFSSFVFIFRALLADSTRLCSRLHHCHHFFFYSFSPPKLFHSVFFCVCVISNENSEADFVTHVRKYRISIEIITLYHNEIWKFVVHVETWDGWQEEISFSRNNNNNGWWSWLNLLWHLARFIIHSMYENINNDIEQTKDTRTSPNRTYFPIMTSQQWQERWCSLKRQQPRDSDLFIFVDDESKHLV